MRSHERRPHWVLKKVEKGVKICYLLEKHEKVPKNTCFSKSLVQGPVFFESHMSLLVGGAPP